MTLCQPEEEPPMAEGKGRHVQAGLSRAKFFTGII